MQVTCMIAGSCDITKKSQLLASLLCSSWSIRYLPSWRRNSIILWKYLLIWLKAVGLSWKIPHQWMDQGWLKPPQRGLSILIFVKPIIQPMFVITNQDADCPAAHHEPNIWISDVLDPFYWHGLIIPAWISNYIQSGMKLLIHSHISTVHPVRQQWNLGIDK